MKFSKLFFLFFLFNVWCFTITAQDMDQLVTLACDNQPLGNVLNDISTNYQVKFTYSRDFIPMDHPVTVAVQKYPLHNVLDLIFAPTPIVYKNIGGNIALRVDETKLQQLTQLQKLPLPDEVHRKKGLRKAKPLKSCRLETHRWNRLLEATGWWISTLHGLSFRRSAMNLTRKKPLLSRFPFFL